MARLRALLRDERGQVLPFVAIAAMVLTITTGLVLVGGLSYAYAELVQQAADAAALAGASTADVLLFYNDPLFGGCYSPVPSSTSDVPCEIHVLLNQQAAEDRAQEALQANAQEARFADRGLTLTGMNLSIVGNGTDKAGVTVEVTAEARVPLLGLFGSDKITIRRKADSQVSVKY